MVCPTGDFLRYLLYTCINKYGGLCMQSESNDRLSSMNHVLHKKLIIYNVQKLKFVSLSQRKNWMKSLEDRPKMSITSIQCDLSSRFKYKYIWM